MTSLIERIESAEGPSYALDCAIGEYVAKTTGTPYIVPPKPYTASIDAALTLVPDDCPRWAVTGRNSAVVERADGRIGTMDWVFAATPALALVGAALRARGAPA